MQCPKCGTKDTRVIDSRVAKNGIAIRRRRLCQECDFRFSTNEEIIREGLFIIKSDGRREEFDQNKIVSGLRRACEKRPIDNEQLQILISDVVTELENTFETELPSRLIGEKIMERLKTIDQIAYVRFASVYKQFHDIDELAQEISGLKENANN